MKHDFDEPKKHPFAKAEGAVASKNVPDNKVVGGIPSISIPRIA